MGIPEDVSRREEMVLGHLVDLGSWTMGQWVFKNTGS